MVRQPVYFSKLTLILMLAGWLCLPFCAYAGERWWEDTPEERALGVNSGPLQFLTTPPASYAHQHHNRISITAASLKTGWVDLKQCHEQLDPVPRSEIVFREGGTRNLTLLTTVNIGRAEVQDATVQLWDVQRGARLCLQAQTRALKADDGNYVLRNGPYMRRFLDGYYPLHVTMSVDWPRELLVLEQVSPRPQPGFRVSTAPGHLAVDTWFTGRLVTELHFRGRR